MIKVNSVLFCFMLISIITLGQKKLITRLDGTKISEAEIDTTIKKLMKDAQVQGLSVAVLKNKKTVFVKSYGYRNKPKNEMLDTATIMYGASFSKAVFGFLTTKLAQEKVLDLDIPLSKYLSKTIGEYDYFSDLKTDERWKLITARMCLNHTTGLPNVRWYHPTTSELDTNGILKIYFTPGSKYAYSGEGFKLLQLTIEEITKKTIEELAIEKVFKPVNMIRTGYIWHDSFGDDNVAVGHMNDGTIDIKRKRTEAVAGGSLVTTIADYARFTEYLMQQKGLDKKWYNEMISSQIKITSITQFPPITMDETKENDAINLSYGLGWGLLKCPQQGRAFFKEGNGGPWKNYNINFIDKGISIIILINSENGETIFQSLIEKLIGNTCIPWKWQGYVSYNTVSK
jgi:CubicO group peptidase (beta-lactamase class C family)